jgi:hypothetical protein
MKKVFLLLALGSMVAWGQTKPETFVVQVSDRSMSINAPEKKRPTFSVLIENRSLSDQVAKFTVQGKILKYVSVKSGQTEAFEIENKTNANVVFVPVSPSFQEAELIFGKKAYEIPSKE